jgi:hypothetical protein
MIFRIAEYFEIFPSRIPFSITREERLVLMKKYVTACSSFALLTIGSLGVAKGDIIGVSGGSGSPGPTLGTYTMTSFAPDYSSYGTQVNSLASPTGGSMLFGQPVTAYPASSFPAYWSNGFTADVYHFSNPSSTNLVLTLPVNTGAFYLYIIPDAYAYPEPITVTAQNGTSVTQIVQSNTTGPEQFGFYATGADTIQTLTISGATFSNGDIFVGQFGIAPAISLPEPSQYVMLAAGLVCMAGILLQVKRCEKAKLPAN